MTTPRTTRLVRVATLADFRRVLLACVDRAVPVARSTAILVPTHAAAEQLRRGFEAAARDRAAVVLPHLMTRRDWLSWLWHHVADAPPLLSEFERDVLLGAAAREAADSGNPPPFSLRAALVGEMLEFYDTFRRQLKSVDDFERKAEKLFGADAEVDRGAARMLAQSRFMVASFRAYETRLASLGRADEHVMRACLLAASDTPLRRVVVSVGDRAGESAGLWAADFDLLARLNGVTAIDVVATDAALASGYLLRLREHLPGIVETTDDAGPVAPPVLDTPAGDTDARHFLHRDREDELAWIVRRTKALVRDEPGARLDRTAVVFKRPLPYVYLARRTFDAAGVPYETVDALPLASEPSAAALDLITENVASGFARASLAALLRSPHFRFESGGVAVTPSAVAVFDRELSERRYLAGPAGLDRLAAIWREAPVDGADVRDGWKRDVLTRVSDAAIAAIAELAPLSDPAPPSTHLDTLRRFLASHDRVPPVDEDVRRRHVRARGAILNTLANLRDAFATYDDRPRTFDDTSATLRRWIERQTFAPQTGGAGVMVTDALAARYGDFDRVYLVGATQRDWPETPPRRIFFPLSMLKDLGWPEEADGRAYDRAAFLDLLRLPRERVAVSTFTLEDDAIVEPSPFLEDIADAGLPAHRDRHAALPRVFVSEALTSDPVRGDALAATPAEWLALRLSRTPATDPRFHGQGRPTAPASYKVSALDRFLECPFVYFSEQVLRLKEEPEDEEGLSPRTQGRVLHEIFEHFFRAWQEAGHGAITAATLDDARRVFAEVVEARLAQMPEGDAAIERTRMMGSPVAPGLGDIVLGLEAERPVEVVERLLEFSLGGEAVFRAADGERRIALRATADRVDLLADGTFRVFDYKLSKPPDVKTAVQLPAYAAAAKARLEGYLGRSWRPSEAAYVAFGRPPYYKPLSADPDKLDGVLVEGERRLADAVDRIERGQFPPRPVHHHRCSYCPFAAVCRKDYVNGEA